MHLSSLTILCHCVRNSPRIWALRIIGMFALFSMMCVAITPTIQWKWPVHLQRNGCRAANDCDDVTTTVKEHLKQFKQGQLSPQGIFAYLLLAFGNPWQSPLLYE